MFFNRRARLGLHPILIIRNQYLDPRVKSALFAVAITLFGFFCFTSGVIYQALWRTKIITVSLDLPENTSLHNIVVDRNYAHKYPIYVHTTGPHFEWNPTAEVYDKAVECLAKNIYFEARNEKTLNGKLAVGLVTINRLVDSGFPKTICDVVWQKRRHPNTKKWVAQFSWTWDGKKDKPLNEEKWEEAEILAHALLAERTLHNVYDFTEGAIYYHADYVEPWWSEKLLELGYGSKQIDTHIHYTPRGPEAFAVAEN